MFAMRLIRLYGGKSAWFFKLLENYRKYRNKDDTSVLCSYMYSGCFGTLQVILEFWLKKEKKDSRTLARRQTLVNHRNKSSNYKIRSCCWSSLYSHWWKGILLYKCDMKTRSGYCGRINLVHHLCSHTGWWKAFLLYTAIKIQLERSVTGTYISFCKPENRSAFSGVGVRVSTRADYTTGWNVNLKARLYWRFLLRF